MDDLYRLLRTGHAQSQGIVDTLTDPMLLLDERLRVEMASRAFLETFNVDRDETIGQSFLALGNGQWDIAELRILLEQVIPRSTVVIDYEVTHDFPALGRRTMTVSARKLIRDAGASHSMLLVIVDATDRLRREAAQEMLLGEVRHRMKNMMAVVQALARRTQAEGRTGSEFRDDFLGRFVALAEAEDIAVVLLEFLPYLEELLRGLAARRRRRGNAQ
jgi:nitrogen-specific signal transduction histidine kinase